MLYAMCFIFLQYVVHILSIECKFLYAVNILGKTQWDTVAKNLPENGANMRTHEPDFLK